MIGDYKNPLYKIGNVGTIPNLILVLKYLRITSDIRYLRFFELVVDMEYLCLSLLHSLKFLK